MFFFVFFFREILSENNSAGYLPKFCGFFQNVKCATNNALFIETSLFVAFRYSIKDAISRLFQKTFSSCLTLTHFLIFLQTSQNSCLCFFLLDQKVGLTAFNHSTYPKLQSNISLKLFVLEPIKKTKQKQIFKG